MVNTCYYSTNANSRGQLLSTICISGIIAGIYHLSFSGHFVFYFSDYIISPPHKVTISVTDCNIFCLKFIFINRLINASFYLVVLITLSSRKVSEVSGLSTRSLPYCSFEVSSFYLSSSLVFFHVCHFCKLNHLQQYVTYHLFQIVKYLQFQDYHHFPPLIIFYFQEEIGVRLV